MAPPNPNDVSINTTTSVTAVNNIQDDDIPADNIINTTTNTEENPESKEDILAFENASSDKEIQNEPPYESLRDRRIPPHFIHGRKREQQPINGQFGEAFAETWDQIDSQLSTLFCNYSIEINLIGYCLGIKEVEGPSYCDIKDVEYGDYDMEDDEFGKDDEFPGLPYFVLVDVDDDSKQQWIEVLCVVHKEAVGILKEIFGEKYPPLRWSFFQDYDAQGYFD